MTNPNNCDTCDYKKMRGPGCDPKQHCYMFYDTPDEQCMQHTGHTDIDRTLADILRTLIVRKETT